MKDNKQEIKPGNGFLFCLKKICLGREGRYRPSEWKRIGMLFIRTRVMKIK